MENYWVIGHPLTFCLTTPVMNGLFESKNMAKEFATVDLKPDKLSEAMDDLRRGALKGLVVTRPHKTPSMELIDEVTEEAKVIGAVNLVLRKEGNLHGYNTDWRGASEAIHDLDINLSGKTVLVLGAGGAARAAAFAYQKEGAEVYIWNRTGERAQAFAEKIGIHWLPDMRGWDKLPDIIVNATALSDQPRQSSLVPFPLWQNVELALDAVYGKTSLFLEEAKAAQVKHVLSGEHWFIHHVEPLFELITGEAAEFDKIQKITQASQEIQRQ